MEQKFIEGGVPEHLPRRLRRGRPRRAAARVHQWDTMAGGT